MTSMLSRLIGERISIVLDRDDDLPLVHINPAQFEQVVLNLVVNARDAMPDGGTIRIATRRCVVSHERALPSGTLAPGIYVSVSVNDTGSGINDAARPHIFEPFFTTKSVDGSRGVGLATADGIVAQHGGAFDIAAEQRVGTTFTFYLPAAHTPVAPATERTPVVRRTGRETILLAEDEETVRTTARVILESRHYTVLEAATPDDAIAICAAHAGVIHLLLSDVIMPGMNGPELARHIVARRPETRVLLMSGYTGDHLDAGDHIDESRFLPKPFSADALTTKVRDVLDAASLRRV